MRFDFKKIEWGIYAMLFALPLYSIRPSFGFIHTTVLEILFFVVLAWWLVLNKSQLGEVWRRLRVAVRSYPMLSAGVTLFLLSATIGIFVAPDKLSALGIWRAYYIEPFIFFLLCLSVIDTPTKIRRAWWSLLASGLCAALFAVFQRFTGFAIPMPWLTELRVTSVYPYPNAVGLYLAPLVAMALPFSRYYFLQSQQREKIKGAVVLAVAFTMLIAIFFAQTEAALVALVVAGGVYGLLFAGTRVRYATILAGVIIGIMIAVSPILQHTLSEKLLLRDWSGFVRQTIWHESSVMLRDHWLVGAGLSGYQTVMVPYHKATYMEIFMFPHNIVLNIWSELGLLGLATMTMLFIWCIRALVCTVRDMRKKKNAEYAQWQQVVLFACVMAAVAMMIHGLVDVPYFKNDLSMLTWFFIALFVCLRKSVTILHDR